METKIRHERIYKTETDSQTQRTDLWLSRGVDQDGSIESLGLAYVNYYI